MNPSDSPGQKGSLAFFASWLLLHEKADDWIRDALRRARETPEDLRGEYQSFLLAVEQEKEGLKDLLSDALRNEFRELGFLHREDASAVRSEVQELRERIRSLEAKLERLTPRE